MTIDKDRWIHELRKELDTNILPWWPRVQDSTGGWPGFIDNQGRSRPSPKGVVMHSRFLWSYSAAARILGETRWLDTAAHARDFLLGPLQDKVHGGFHWMIREDGRPVTPNKVIYGQAFAVYSLAEYYRVSQDPAIKAEAMKVFRLMETHARDHQDGGYYEAVSADWQTVVPNALGDQDVKCEKSMNTNLHVMEAWTCLWLATRDEAVRQALEDLIWVHLDKIRTEPAHFGLYFDRQWHSSHQIRSFGHDIEGSWLIREAAEAIWGHHVPAKVDEAVMAMAARCAAILDQHGPGLINEEHEGHLDHTRIWWVQAECLVGMINAWQVSGDAAWLARARQVWDYIQDQIVDHEHGEWFWGRDPAGQALDRQAKGGLWKTSYHNGRACLEALQRLGAVF